MWKVPSVSCDRTFSWNARHVLATRVDEVYAHAGALADPLDAKGLHDLRISIKRLRYSLEFFAACYDPAETAEILEHLSVLQDHLGELHDADVFIPELQRTFERLESDRRIAMRVAIDESRGRTTPRDFESFAAAISRDLAHDPRDGILGAINRLRAQRRDHYAAAVELWGRVSEAGFHERLVRLGTNRGEEGSE
jgi:hypothetical protein